MKLYNLAYSLYLTLHRRSISYSPSSITDEQSKSRFRPLFFLGGGGGSATRQKIRKPPVAPPPPPPPPPPATRLNMRKPPVASLTICHTNDLARMTDHNSTDYYDSLLLAIIDHCYQNKWLPSQTISKQCLIK